MKIVFLLHNINIRVSLILFPRVDVPSTNDDEKKQNKRPKNIQLYKSRSLM